MSQLMANVTPEMELACGLLGPRICDYSVELTRDESLRVLHAELLGDTNGTPGSCVCSWIRYMYISLVLLDDFNDFWMTFTILQNKRPNFT